MRREIHVTELDVPLPESIYDELRQRILSLTEVPGTTVTETAVALRFGVARPTARLAIERLVADGLLRRESHKAARVPDLTRDDILDLFYNRAIVEGSAVGRLADAGAIPSAALDAHRQLRSLHDDDAFAALDIAFHRGLVAGQPSQRLARMHTLLMGEIELAIAQVQANHLFTATEVASQHQGILDAVTAGDTELAEKLTREHIRDSRDRLVSHLNATTK
jgi:DNA-binding GntR family transcriptional regulator